MELRAVRRRAAEDRDRQPRQPRRPGPHQGRPLPRAQDARGVRLRLPALDQPRHASCTSASSTSSPAARTSSCSARPAPARRHLAIALGIRACLAGHRVAFRTATEWVALLADAQRHGRLDDELDRLQRIPLLIVDEVGYIPFDPQAANLMFMLVSPPLRTRLADRHLQQALQRLGRDLRRRRRRRRHDRPARPPRRDPRPQRRLLPPQRPRPRPPAGRQNPRNRLTDHPRAPRRSPQTAITRLDLSANAPVDPETELS